MRGLEQFVYTGPFAWYFKLMVSLPHNSERFCSFTSSIYKRCHQAFSRPICLKASLDTFHSNTKHLIKDSTIKKKKKKKKSCNVVYRLVSVNVCVTGIRLITHLTPFFLPADPLAATQEMQAFNIRKYPTTTLIQSDVTIHSSAS
jgi:hypothetical protein